MEQSQYEPGPLEYQSAMRTVRCVKNILLVLVALVIVAQLAAACAVQFGHVFDEPKDAPTSAAAHDKAQALYMAMCVVLPASRFVGLVSCCLFALTLLLAIDLVLIGRLGGARGMIGAFFWTLLLLALLTPWQQILPSSRAGCMARCDAMQNPIHPVRQLLFDREPMVWGALYDIDEFLPAYERSKNLTGPGLTTEERVFYYIRFFAYPAVALLIAAMAQLRFASGWRKMRLPPDLTILAPQPKV